MKRTIIFLSLIACFTRLYAQEQRVKIVEHDLKTHKQQDTLRVNRLNELQNLITLPVGKLDSMANEALSISRKLHYNEGEAESLIALARAKPNELNVALATPSSSGALAAELFKILTNTQMVSVPFKGGAPALTAMVSGEVQLIFTTPPTVMPYIKGGKVRVLGTSGKDRVPYLPEVPTLAEAGIKDFNTAPWQGLIAPAGTPPAIIDKLYRQVGEMLKTPYAQERFMAAGTDVVGSSPKEFGELIRRELAQNSKVIKAVGMRAD